MPRFERLEIKDLYYHGPFLKIDLKDPSELEIEKFDREASVLYFGSERFARTGIYTLKHIVLGDVLFAFNPEQLQYIDSYEILRRLKIQEVLQSAGEIERRAQTDKVFVRTIKGWSSSLESAHLLDSRFSGHYRIDVIKPALDKYFRVL